MDIITLTVIFSVILIIAEAIGWGTFGYIFLRLLGFKDNHWRWNWLIIFVIFMILDSCIKAYLLKLDISIGNKEVLAFFDNDINNLFKIEFSDIWINAIEIFLGYLFGGFIFNKALQKRSSIGFKGEDK